MADMLDIGTQDRRQPAVAPGGAGKIPRVASRSKTLLEPGHEAEWASLDAEKREALTPSPDIPVSELLRRGQHLSAQAGALLRAVERADGRAGS
jgi:hypothetical protein